MLTFLFQAFTNYHVLSSFIFLHLDERKRFTVQLVKTFVWLQEEMQEPLARSVARTVLLPRYIEEIETKKTRSKLVGCMLKQVLGQYVMFFL